MATVGRRAAMAIVADLAMLVQLTMSPTFKYQYSGGETIREISLTVLTSERMTPLVTQR